ncbi:MAG: sec-independent protein translocase [Tardiphaga sp.]|nr:sec-independent protein translocase [Tardiphaga sp.]
MFDIGWSELVVIGVVALIAIGPKELPGVLRMVGQWMGKARKMASEFQGQFNEAMREAEMADLKKTFDDVKDAANDLSTNNIMTSMQKDAAEALRIDDLNQPPATPTTPEPPTPETFFEAEAHQAANAPLAITQEVQAAQPLDITPDAASEHAPVLTQDTQPSEMAPVAVEQDASSKDAKAS